MPQAALADFVDVVLADDDLVRREFEAIITHGWGGDVPEAPTPQGGGQSGHGRGSLWWRATGASRLARGTPPEARERSPPGRRRVPEAR